MKNFYFSTFLLLLSMTFFSFEAEAQAPQSMTYQSVIRNSSNALVANIAVSIKISVLQGSSTGNEAYVETQTATTNANGLVSLQIGAGTAILGTFAAIDWANGPYFIKTEIDPTGGSNYTITGTQQMASVPYALYAAKSGGTVFEPTVDFPDAIHNTNAGNVGIGTDLPSAKLDVSGDIRIRGGNPAQGKVLTSDDTGAATWQTPAVQLTVFEPTIDMPDAIHNTNAGNVGIGTDLPSEKLDVSGNLRVRGNVGIGTETPNTSAALEIKSNTGALLIPRMTTSERNNLTASEGMIIYNSTDLKYQGFSNNIVNSDPVVDQTQLSFDYASTEQDMSQSFTAGISGTLSTVRVLLNTDMDPQNATIYIRSGAGNSGVLLYQTTVTVNPQNGAQWYAISPAGVTVSAGSTYTIHMTSSGFGSMSGINWPVATNNPYAGGFFSDGFSGPDFDAAFETTVSQLPTSSLQWASLNPSFGGNPAQGKVLTSDDNGTATWQTPASPDLTGYATTATVDNNLATIQAIIATQAAQMIVLQAQIISLLPTTVLIGTQTWNRKNLNVTTYRDGTPIPEVQGATAWANLTIGAWCHYNNDPANDAIYGKLYNWYAVNDSRGLAPAGFHVPTDTELSAVSNMRNPNGFAGLPGGQRLFNGEFVQIGEIANWWSSSVFYTNYALFRYLNYSNGSVGGFNDTKPYGLSVRCVSN